MSFLNSLKKKQEEIIEDDLIIEKSFTVKNKDDLINEQVDEEIKQEIEIQKAEEEQINLDINNPSVKFKELPSVIQTIIVMYDNLEEIEIRDDELYIISDSKEKLNIDEEEMKSVNKLFTKLLKDTNKSLTKTNAFVDIDLDIEVDDSTINDIEKLKDKLKLEGLTIKPINEIYELLKEIKFRINLISSEFIDYKNNIANFRINNKKRRLSEEQFNTLIDDNQELKEYFKGMIDNNKKPSILVAGATGSGKTELQKYMLKDIPNLHKLIMLQDTKDTALKELYPEKDIIEIFANGVLDMNSAIITCLRQNPDWICISEIRNEEAVSFVRALRTGHASITTIHANNTLEAIYRLAELYLENINIATNIEEIAEQIEKNIDIIIYLEKVWNEDTKKYERKIIEISEKNNKHHEIIYRRNQISFKEKFEEKENIEIKNDEKENVVFNDDNYSVMVGKV